MPEYRVSTELIVIDIDMPFQNGIEATRQIKSLMPEVQVIVLTGNDTEERCKLASDAGAAAIVPKWVLLKTSALGTLNGDFSRSRC